MSTHTSYTKLTITELAKRMDPGGDIQTIAEVLAETNEILMDIPFVEANGVTYHKDVRRLALPTPTWAKINEGVTPTASRTVEVTAGIGMLEDYVMTDKRLVDLANDPAKFRMEEARAHIEAMGQEMAGTMLYGSAATEPEAFDGLATLMPSLDTDGNILNAGGSGNDNTSIYVIQWGPGKVFGVYPRGSKAGLSRSDDGLEIIGDETNGYIKKYVDHFIWKAGLFVKDDRCIGRVANIEASGSTNIFNEDDLITLLNRMPQRGKGAVIYCNETVHTQMEIALKDKNNVNYTPSKGEGLAGDVVLYFRGHPVRLVDQILNTEDTLS